MALISIDDARQHLRLEADYPEEQIAPKLSAAVSMAVQFLERNLYETADALTTARTAAPTKLVEAGAAYRDALEAAAALEDPVAREMASGFALSAYKAVQEEARRTYAGLVVDDQLRAGILLTLGHLFENRSSVEVGATVKEIPMGAQYVLWPFRQLGV